MPRRAPEGDDDFTEADRRAIDEIRRELDAEFGPLERPAPQRVFGAATRLQITTDTPTVEMAEDGASAVSRFRKRYVIEGPNIRRRGEVLQERRRAVAERVRRSGPRQSRWYNRPRSQTAAHPRADVAQLVEQPIRNRQVPGSSPGVGSITRHVILASRD